MSGYPTQSRAHCNVIPGERVSEFRRAQLGPAASPRSELRQAPLVHQQQCHHNQHHAGAHNRLQHGPQQYSHHIQHNPQQYLQEPQCTRQGMQHQSVTQHQSPSSFPGAQPQQELAQPHRPPRSRAGGLPPRHPGRPALDRGAAAGMAVLPMREALYVAENPSFVPCIPPNQVDVARAVEQVERAREARAQGGEWEVCCVRASGEAPDALPFLQAALHENPDRTGVDAEQEAEIQANVDSQVVASHGAQQGAQSEPHREQPHTCTSMKQIPGDIAAKFKAIHAKDQRGAACVDIFSSEKCTARRREASGCIEKEKRLVSDALRSAVRCQTMSSANFEVIKPLGRGGYAMVHLVRERATGTAMALKAISRETVYSARQGIPGRRVSRLMSEKCALQMAHNSPWIVKLFYTFQDGNNFYMVMEVLNGGSFDRVLDVFYPLPRSWTMVYLAQIVKALHAVHTIGFIHRDLKPENVALDYRGKIKLLDFGLARSHPAVCNQPQMSVVGTPQFMAPEMALEPVYTRSVDWWSTGMFLARCIDKNFDTVEVPFTMDVLRGPGREALPQKVDGFIAEMQARSIDGEPEATDLMHNLLVPAAERLDVFGIMQHEFFHPLRLPFHDVDGERIWGDNDLLNIPPPWQPPVDGPNDVSMQGASEDSRVEPLPDAKPCGAAKLDVAGYTMVARD
mmetsp:Transcript_44358/g.94525  ORF Transcript_44358/g.94525 Transcript_44358/m.94525 type:complete len:682 (+) Transcript_44358:51-2096(+)